MKHLRNNMMTWLLTGALLFSQAPVLKAQIWKNPIKVVTQGGGCAAGGIGGVLLGGKIADIYISRMKLTGNDAEKARTGFKVGGGLAGCAGGAALAGTTYAKLSKGGKQAREKELMAALDDAQPRNYRDPDNATLIGSLKPQAPTMEGKNECRVVEDELSDGSNTSTALLKYCRGRDGQWKYDAL
jgi:surface antigen